jgi:hypothetical protein
VSTHFDSASHTRDRQLGTREPEEDKVHRIAPTGTAGRPSRPSQACVRPAGGVRCAVWPAPGRVRARPTAPGAALTAWREMACPHESQHPAEPHLHGRDVVHSSPAGTHLRQTPHLRRSATERMGSHRCRDSGHCRCRPVSHCPGASG